MRLAYSLTLVSSGAVGRKCLRSRPGFHLHSSSSSEAFWLASTARAASRIFSADFSPIPGISASSSADFSSRSPSVAIPASASCSAVFSPMPGTSATGVCRRREACEHPRERLGDLALDLALALDLDLHADQRGGEPDVLALLADRERELVVLDDAVEAHRRRPRGGSARRA